MCISVLNCVKVLSNSERYLPKERGTLSVICINSGDSKPIAGSGAHRVLRYRCQEPIVCISTLHCVKMRSFVIINIINARYLNSERYLHKWRR